MRGKIFSLIAFFAVGILGVQAQEQDRKITFDKTIEEFGTVEQNAPTQTVFTFTNTSDVPVKLLNVKASCGCTTPSYTKTAVAPGETGEINVRYNSSRVGPFYKSITVSYDSVEKPVVLYIRGKVEAPQPAIVYQHTVGGLAFDQVSASTGELARDQVKTFEFHVKNISPVEIQFTGAEKSKAFDVQYSHGKLAPGQEGSIKVVAHGVAFDRGGDFSELIRIQTDEKSQSVKELTLTGQVAFSQNELEGMPNIQFANLNYEGGTAIEGEKITYKYAFTNTGNQDLLIESVKASCGCTASAPRDKVIKPGESSEIIATFDSKGRVGKQTKTITVNTNDPDQPVTQLRLSVVVEKDPFKLNNQEGAPVARPGSSFQ